ncbi:protein-disulfide reductase DsbD [Sulfurivirga sp.]|uniref:protein-disulfide reductase DsbD n=1 Tax=Sulfurivirga sp. TaxID=2614236 RepID=UPI0025EF043E|nr:protein-disulfide reductase DsbD [Sulfurivirga sp.]
MKRYGLHTLFIWLLLALGAALAAEDPIDVNQAFQFEGVTVDNGQPVVRWRIADGYYLYQKRFSFRADKGAVTPDFPPPDIKDDPIFGKTPVYHKEVAIPLKIEGASGPVRLTVKYQGCWEGGVCYPPQTRTVTVELPQSATPAQNDANPLAALEKLITPQDAQDGPLPVEQAFRFTSKREGNRLILDWTIAPKYYLYRDRIKLVPRGELKLGDFTLPPADTKDDPIFGKTQVYHNRLTLTVPVEGSGTVTVKYQGCWEGGVCYPPQEKQLTVKAKTSPTPSAQGETAAQPGSESHAPTGATGTAPAAQSEAAAPAQSDTDRITDALKHSGFWAVIGLFFVFGLLLAFTPCVFPMVPILSSIIVGQGEQMNARKGFVLSLTYVLAMALAYTAAGVIAGLFGANLQAALQNPWVLGTFALVFVALALSMFGFYELQLPAGLQTRINALANRQQGGTLTGVAIMGVLSALIVGPCVAPPLAGALIYIGQTGDAVLGGAALFAMAMGMGLPLIVAGTLGAKYLPRAGGWMDSVKAVFGVVMLGLALWIAERILPDWLTVLLAALLIITSAIYMGALEPVDGKSGWWKLWKGLGFALLVWGVLLLVGLARGTPDLLTPLKGLNGGSTATTTAQPGHFEFQRINSLDELKAQLGKGKPVLLDFYADWCVSCKEMERFTFSDPQVQALMKRFVALQADVTANRPEHKALMKALGVIGPPAILFFDPQGREIRALRVVGTKSPEAFAAILRQALGQR